MVFKTGDAIVHPVRGAGVVMSLVERELQGDLSRYYRIKLLSHPDTKVMIPTSAAEELGLRRAIAQSKLKKVWKTLFADPKKLPKEYKRRYKILRDKLGTGDVFKVTEVVRDMAWRQSQKGRLNTGGKRIYEEGIRFLAGEIAASQGIEYGEAEQLVRSKLMEVGAATDET